MWLVNFISMTLNTFLIFLIFESGWCTKEKEKKDNVVECWVETHTTFLVMSLSFRAFKAGSKSDFSKFAFPAILHKGLCENILISCFREKMKIKTR